MLKIKVKNLLTEAALPYSKKLSSDIFNFTQDFINKKHKQDFIKFEVPILDLLDDNPNLLNGAIAFSALNLEKKNLNKLKNSWSSQNKSFNFDLKQKLNNVKVPIYLSLESLEKKDDAKTALFDIDNDDIQIAIQIDPQKHINRAKHLTMNIAHELRHVTQIVKDLMMRYYNELIKADDISNINKLNYSLSVKYGLGKKVNLSRSDDVYLTKDIEYKPWISLIVDRYTNWLIAHKKITRKILDTRKDSIHNLAVEVLKDLLDNKETLKSFGEQTGAKGVKFINYYKNNKRFINELLKELEDKLSKL